MRASGALRRHFRRLLAFGLDRRQLKIEARRLDELLREAVTWAAPKAGTANPVSDVTSAVLLGLFLQDRCRRDLDSLKGHRSVGGIRASIYNAMPREGVVALRDFMHEFREQNAR